MQGLRGNIWILADADPNGFVVVPTNTTLRKDGKAVMGAGLAKEAAERHPALPGLLAAAWSEEGYTDGVHDFPEIGIVCFPTKRDWREPSDLGLIKSGCKQLAQLATLANEATFYVPLLGCGLGRLDWATQVRPILVHELRSCTNVVVVKS